MSYNWRDLYFNETMCNGIVTNNNDGNVTVKGKVKGNNPNVKVIYWAANPPDDITSFSGRGLPFKDPEHAFDNSVNVGMVESNNYDFQFTIFYPNSYYVGLGSVYIEPQVHIKICDPDNESKFMSIKLGAGIPYRTLTHPAPPSKNYRVDANFYNTGKLPIRSQEQILRDSGYPEYDTIPPSIPDNFWGLRPPR